MSKKRVSIFFQTGIFFIIAILTVILVYWRLKYGLYRYYDIDEFAYLHWAHNLISGLHPYVDFFYFLPPFYLYFVSLFFHFVTRTSFILMLQRIASFGIYVLSGGTLFLIIKKMSSSKTAILSLFFFAFLPMPLDKWIEVRPDGLATLLALLGVYFLILYLQKRSAVLIFLSGFLFSIAVLVLPKVVFFAGMGCIVLGIHAYIHKSWRDPIFFCTGAIIPIVIMFGLFLFYGDFSKALYLVFHVASDATNVLGKKFNRESDLNFRPNGAYYGLEWYNLSWRMSQTVWIFGSIWAIKKFVSFLDEKNISSSLTSLLLCGIYWLNFVTYVKIVPLKHAQYLIPMTPLIAYFFADFCLHFMGYLRRNAFGGKLSAYLFFIGIIIGPTFYGAQEMYQVKLKYKYDDQLKYYTNLYSFLPPNEPVFDLSGETVYYPEGYYFCCIPYGQYEEALTFSYPDLETELRKKEVKFVHVQEQARIGVIPLHQQKVITDYYIPYHSLVTSSVYVSGAIRTFSTANQEVHFNLIAKGMYGLYFNALKVQSQGIGNWIKIDGIPVVSNPIFLTSGSHSMTINGVGEMTIRYNW